jgi:hypothetical protein
VRWRVAPAAEAVVHALGPLRFASRREVPGLEVLKDRDPVFWGRLRLDGRDYFVKGRRSRGAGELVRSILRPSPFEEEWRKTWWLRARGIETAVPVAVGSVRRLGSLVETFLVTSWIEGSRDVLGFLTERQRELTPARFARLERGVATALGRLFGSLHAAGAWHRQFHDRNILVREDGPRFRLVPIDLDHLTIAGTLTDADRDWNFYQLAWHFRRLIERFRPGPRDLVCFLRGYGEATRAGGPSRWRELARHLGTFLPRAPLPARPQRKDFKAPG